MGLRFLYPVRYIKEVEITPHMYTTLHTQEEGLLALIIGIHQMSYANVFNRCVLNVVEAVIDFNLWYFFKYISVKNFLHDMDKEPFLRMGAPISLTLAEVKKRQSGNCVAKIFYGNSINMI